MLDPVESLQDIGEDSPRWPVHGSFIQLWRKSRLANSISHSRGAVDDLEHFAIRHDVSYIGLPIRCPVLATKSPEVAHGKLWKGIGKVKREKGL